MFLSRYVLIILGLSCCLTASANNSSPLLVDENVAENLYKIALFISWPHYALNYSTIQFCFYKTRLSVDSEKLLNSKRVKQRRISYIQLDTLDKANNCHLLYSQSANIDDYKSLQTLSHENPILTINPNQDFIQHGGMIQLKTSKKPAMMRIHKTRIEGSFLTIDSSLLMLADEVIRK